MDNKYWVPALQKAKDILQLIAAEPNQFKLIDLSKKLEINKSSMFSLLRTMEELQWVVRGKGDTYTLGSYFGLLGSAYFRQFDIISEFHREAVAAKTAIGETIQLAKLEGNEVLYLAKEEADSPVRLASDPGMKFPAHATALGKVLLAGLTQTELGQLFQEETLRPLTPYSLNTRSKLYEELETVRLDGFALDDQEAVVGFQCIAAPIRGAGGKVVAAVSCSMPRHQWEEKKAVAQAEITRLAARLSHSR
jgi:DNA-binding IclR family transcriptional regulator